MRRPPFTVRPLALSVTLALASPIAMATDATTINNTQPSNYGSVQLTASDNAININSGVTTTVTGVVSADAASTQLIKQGTGTLSLTNNNTYAGGTTVQEGTLNVARATSLGAGAINLAGATTLETTNSSTFTQDISLSDSSHLGVTVSTTGKENITQVTSTITGDGNLIKSGEGILSLTADNAYMGQTTIQQGTLAISRSASLGDVTNAVIINDGATLKTNQDVNVVNDVTISSTNTGKIDTGGKNSTISGAILGGGTLEKIGNGSLTLSGTGNAQGNTILNGGILIIKDNTNSLRICT